MAEFGVLPACFCKGELGTNLTVVGDSSLTTGCVSSVSNGKLLQL